jgi:RimJ/RimL family protein N-acetyltransferase
MLKSEYVDGDERSLVSKVELREVTADDLPIFFDQQLDQEANWSAAFTAKDPADRDAFSAHWSRIMGDPSVTLRTVLYNESVAGYVAKFQRFGEPEVSYWFGREFWGKGIATWALTDFLIETTTRPLYARAAVDNLASIRVLEKCGFNIFGHDQAFSHARGSKVREVILRLK